MGSEAHWQEGAGGLLLVAAAQETGLLPTLLPISTHAFSWRAPGLTTLLLSVNYNLFGVVCSHSFYIVDGQFPRRRDEKIRHGAGPKGRRRIISFTSYGRLRGCAVFPPPWFLETIHRLCLPVLVFVLPLLNIFTLIEHSELEEIEFSSTIHTSFTEVSLFYTFVLDERSSDAPSTHLSWTDVVTNG